MTLGRYPIVTLAEAIEQGWDLVRAADKGEDPNAQRDASRAMAAQVPAVDVLLAQYEQESKNKTAADIVKAIRRAMPEDGVGMSAALVGPAEVVPALKALARAGNAPTAVRTWSYISGFIQWANTTYDNEINDWVGAYHPVATRNIRDRVLAFDEVRQVLAAADAHMASYWRSLVWILVLTGLRRDEAADALWPKVDFKARIWTIPSERMKNGKAHLTPKMIAVLKDAKNWQRSKNMCTDLVFTSAGVAPVSGFAKARERLRRYSGVEDWTFRDLRRTILTRLVSDLDEDDGLADLILAHSRQGVQKHCDKATRIDARRRAHEAYEAAILGVAAVRAGDARHQPGGDPDARR